MSLSLTPHHGRSCAILAAIHLPPCHLVTCRNWGASLNQTPRVQLTTRGFKRHELNWSLNWVCWCGVPKTWARQARWGSSSGIPSWTPPSLACHQAAGPDGCPSCSPDTAHLPSRRTATGACAVTGSLADAAAHCRPVCTHTHSHLYVCTHLQSTGDRDRQDHQCLFGVLQP